MKKLVRNGGYTGSKTFVKVVLGRFIEDVLVEDSKSERVSMERVLNKRDTK